MSKLTKTTVFLLLTFFGIVFASQSTARASSTTRLAEGKIAALNTHNYDRISLSTDIEYSTVASVHNYLSERYGNTLIEWQVTENDNHHYVYAYPTGDSLSFSSTKTTGTRSELARILEGSNSRCVILYQHRYYWGQRIALCGLKGRSYTHHLGGMYMNNKASSFRATHDTSWATVYDRSSGNRCSSRLGNLSWARYFLPRSMNDKITCVISHH